MTKSTKLIVLETLKEIVHHCHKPSISNGAEDSYHEYIDVLDAHNLAGIIHEMIKDEEANQT